MWTVALPCTEVDLLVTLNRNTHETWCNFIKINLYSGFYDHSLVQDLLQECTKMSTFDHLNVLTLTGVCLDGGPAPYIIMPFMVNGSLLSHLKRNRNKLVIIDQQEQDVCLHYRQSQKNNIEKDFDNNGIAAT